MTPAHAAPFLDYLTRSHLLDQVQLDEVTARLQGQHPDPRDLARELMRRGWLTAFQVNQLVNGRGAALLLGPYILLERIGEGGMGQVFKARHRHLGRVVAVKVLRKEALEEPMAVRRFLREVEACAQLDHPNIVRALDADEVCGIHYLAMDYIEGTDLARMVKQTGPLRVAQACDYIRQAALGLQHAHERGLVHRDIKPANLLVTPPDKGAGPASPAQPSVPLGRWGTVKILDLGLARLHEPPTGQDGTMLTQLGCVMGTPDFIAPEQVRNSHNADIRADLYSLGCTLYYLLAGQAPFPCGTITEKLLQHQLDDPQPLEEARRARLLGGAQHTPPSSSRTLHIPPSVAELVRRLMAKSPEERLQTPAELADVLTSLLTRARSSSLLKRCDSSAVRTRPKATAATPRSAEPATRPLVNDGPTVVVPGSVAEATPAARPQRRQAPARAATRSRRVMVGCGLLLVCLLASRIHPRGGPTTMADSPGPSRAEAAWQALRVQAERAGADPRRLRSAILDYRVSHPGLHAVEAADLLAPLSSPLDQLGEDWLPRQERFAWQPQELIGILGGRWLAPKIPALTVAISPDATKIAGGWQDNLIRLWDVEKGDPATMRALGGHRGPVVAVAFSPDSKLLASAAHDGTARVWDAATGTARTPLRRHGDQVVALAFAPDGRRLVTGNGDGTVTLWDVRAGHGRRLAPGSRAGKVLSVAFAPSGSVLACGGADGQVAILALGVKDQDTVLASTKLAVPCRVLAFSPDGCTLACGGADGVLYLESWTASRLSPRAALSGHNGPIHGVAFSPDGRTLASVGEDGRLILWKTADGTKVREWQLRWPIHGVAFASDGRDLATANANGTLYVLRLRTPPAAPGADAVTVVGRPIAGAR
jgi:serine/threonine-protein kinase